MQLRFYLFEQVLILLEETVKEMIRLYREDFLPVQAEFSEPVTAQKAGSLVFYHQEWQLSF